MVRGKRGLGARRTEAPGGWGGESALLAGRGGTADGLTDHGRVGDVWPGRSGCLGKLTAATAGCAGPGGGGDWTAAY